MVGNVPRVKALNWSYNLGCVKIVQRKLNFMLRTSDSLNEGLPIKMTREKFQRK